MKKVGRSFLFVLAGGLSYAVLGARCVQGPAEPSIRVVGTVTAIVSDQLPLAGSRVAFKSSNGVIEGETNLSGRYQVFLESDAVYSAEVRAKGLCTVHRPAFRPTTTGDLTFDFTMVVCANVDPVEVDVTDEREMYQEESLDQQGADSAVMIAFGTRSVRDGTIRYGPLHVAPRNVLPVTISYGRNTVRGDVAVLDVTNKVISMSGHVSVYDGISPVRYLPCTVLKLRDTSQLHQCGSEP